MAEPLIRLSGVGKRFANGVRALHGISLRVDAGEVVCIVGPSGSGKSTLLRALNGLETVSEGEVWVDGFAVHDPHADLNALRRKVGMVFQQFNLFPHLTALENLMLAPRVVSGRGDEEVRAAAQALLEKVGLGDRGGSYPAQLSGGQQQRVAIARALAMQPDLLLFDEPTSALDPEKVKEVLDVIERLARDGNTLVIVTHEMGFARAVADRVLFMDGGELVCAAPPEEFFERPPSGRLRAFLGQVLK